MDRTEDERVLMLMNTRVEILCHLMNWTVAARLVCRVLYELPPAQVMSERALARGTYLSRSTIRRNVTMLATNHMVEQRRAGWRLTGLGRTGLISSQREVMRVALGLQKGFSPAMLDFYGSLPNVSKMRLHDLAEITFPANIPLSVKYKAFLGGPARTTET